MGAKHNYGHSPKDCERCKAQRRAELDGSFATMLASHAGQGEVGGTPVEWTEGYEAARLDIGRSVAAVLKLRNPSFDANLFYEEAKLSIHRESFWTPMKQATLSECLGPAVDELWENEAFLCTVRYEPVTGGLVGRDGLLSLSISRRDGDPIGDSSNVTRVKDDVAGVSRIGLSQSDDDVTVVHVWVMPEGIALPDPIEGGTR